MTAQEPNDSPVMSPCREAELQTTESVCHQQATEVFPTDFLDSDLIPQQWRARGFLSRNPGAGPSNSYPAWTHMLSFVTIHILCGSQLIKSTFFLKSSMQHHNPDSELGLDDAKLVSLGCCR